MTEFVFTPAVKEQEKARIALDGPSGSGKTWSALAIAQGLGARIAVIDTEKGSASKYAGDFAFDTLKLYSYDPRDLPKALSAAASSDHDVVIVDSLSHFWMGTDGLLSQVDRITARSQSKNSWSAWKDANPMEQAMIDALLTYPGHVIVTMRTKTEWVVTEDERGKKSPTKIGTKPVQRDGIEYEFDLVGDMDLSNTLVVSKSRISTLSGAVVQRPGIELGETIREWLSDGVKLPTVRDYLAQLESATDAEQVRTIYREVMRRNLGAAPCTNSDGQSATLIGLITEKGAMLGSQGSSAPVTPVSDANAPVGVQRSAPSQPEPSDWDSPAPSAENQPLTTHQKQQIMKLLWERCGLKEHDERMARLNVEVGRDLASTNDLSYAEAQQLIRKLESLPVSQLAGASA